MTEFRIADPNYIDRIKKAFENQPMMKTMGITLELVEAAHVEFRMDFAEHLTQQNGFLHAGALSTALDSACGFSAYTLMAADSAVLTIENKINLLRPGVNGPFHIVGQVVKAGKAIVVSEGTAYDANGKLVATMSATNMAVDLNPA